MRVGLSFDVEELEQVPSLGFVAQCDELLRLLEPRGARATFFVVGSLVPRCLDLLRRIHRAGHEVALHGYEHRKLAELAPERFVRELRPAVERVQAAIGAPVLGYRAPFLSLARRTLWVVDALAELGFVYDSSLCPTAWSSVPVPTAASSAFRFPNGLYEVPVSVAPLGPVGVLPCGGGYLRWLPYAGWRRSIAARVRAAGSAVVYFHNYELDGAGGAPPSPRPAAVPRKRARSLRLLLGSCGSGRSFRAKLEHLLEDFDACALRELLPAQLSSRARPPDAPREEGASPADTRPAELR